jgi:hypothetical protein
MEANSDCKVVCDSSASRGRSRAPAKRTTGTQFGILPTKDAGHPVDSEQLQHYEIISYTEISE